MKNKMKFAFIVVIAVLVIAAWSMVNNRPASINSLLLDNIEALADGESVNGHCVGVGSVDCPYNGNKVLMVYEN